MIERLGGLEQRQRSVGEHTSTSAEGLAHPYDAVSVGKGQRSQEETVDDAEHRGVGADAEGEGKSADTANARWAESRRNAERISRTSVSM